jgi:peptidoglycan/LPS O-acetylase OafA/YrhL
MRKLPKIIPEFDGLRGIAIAVVLLFHLKVPGTSLGWLGVQLFFVLSGTLITGILLDSKEKEGYFKNFYARRMLRIFPIYYITLAAVMSYALTRGLDVGNWPYYLLYAQNYVLVGGAWAPRFPGLLAHTWSLAIEEQFYLIWPLLVWMLSRRSVMTLSLLGIVGAAVFRWGIVISGAEPGLAIAPLPAQIDALCAGAVVALLLRSNVSDPKLFASAWAALVGSGLAVALLVMANGPERYWSPAEWVGGPGNFVFSTVAAVFFASLITLAILGVPTLSAVLKVRVLRHLGRISYGIYLYHYPAFFLVDAVEHRLGLQWGSVWGGLLKVAVTYGCAVASWHLLEKRLLGLKRYFEVRDGRESSASAETRISA